MPTETKLQTCPTVGHETSQSESINKHLKEYIVCFIAYLEFTSDYY